MHRKLQALTLVTRFFLFQFFHDFSSVAESGLVFISAFSKCIQMPNELFVALSSEAKSFALRAQRYSLGVSFFVSDSYGRGTWPTVSIATGTFSISVFFFATTFFFSRSLF